jgi:hypothetical protein
MVRQYQDFFDESGLTNFTEYENKVKEILSGYDKMVIDFVIEMVIDTWFSDSSYHLFSEEFDNFKEKNKISQSELESAFTKVFNELKLQESFIIPKSIRKFNPLWKDEDIALEILKELKSLKGNSEGITKLLISENRGYSFIVDGFKFHVKYGFRMGPGGGRYSGEMKMNDKYMEVSTEVCKQIFNLVEQLKNTDFIEQEEDDKKDFRINRGLM